MGYLNDGVAKSEKSIHHLKTLATAKRAFLVEHWAAMHLCLRPQRKYVLAISACSSTVAGNGGRMVMSGLSGVALGGSSNFTQNKAFIRYMRFQKAGLLSIATGIIFGRASDSCLFTPHL